MTPLSAKMNQVACEGGKPWTHRTWRMRSRCGTNSPGGASATSASNSPSMPAAVAAPTGLAKEFFSFP
jgi:hypothetical protein